MFLNGKTSTTFLVVLLIKQMMLFTLNIFRISSRLAETIELFLADIVMVVLQVIRKLDIEFSGVTNAFLNSDGSAQSISLLNLKDVI